MAPRISLEDVSVCYPITRQRILSFKEYAIHWMKGLIAYDDLWALRGVDLTVSQGERLGVVGPNGAGKSTLVKVIAGVLPRTAGRVAVNGRVAAILELGAGFDHELTGRENIVLNALLMGRTRREIAEKCDEIVAFSGLETLIDAPMRKYSTGMIARLGFSVATAWVPDILILDEVLAVGDADFRNKCEERIATFRHSGVTLLLISHSPRDIVRNCNRCIWLQDGRIQTDGHPREVLGEYLGEERVKELDEATV